MKIVRFGVWGIIVILFTLLAFIPAVWATPEQGQLNQTIPTGTPPAISTAVVPPDGTPTTTPIPLLPPSGSSAHGNGFFILTGIVLIVSALALLLNAQRMKNRHIG